MFILYILFYFVVDVVNRDMSTERTFSVPVDVDAGSDDPRIQRAIPVSDL